VSGRARTSATSASASRSCGGGVGVHHGEDVVLPEPSERAQQLGELPPGGVVRAHPPAEALQQEVDLLGGIAVRLGRARRQRVLRLAQ
jgi:hypothetical protein